VTDTDSTTPACAARTSIASIDRQSGSAPCGAGRVAAVAGRVPVADVALVADVPPVAAPAGSISRSAGRSTTDASVRSFDA
jgi:hypothetical protein